MGQAEGKRFGTGISTSSEKKASGVYKAKQDTDSGVKACSADNDYSCQGFPLMDVPDDILYEVLKWVSAGDIVKSCIYVCRQWKNVIDTQMFWKEKCIQDLGYTNEILYFHADEDFKLLYFKRPYQNNLIKNPDASVGFRHWEIHQNGGDHWGIQATHTGCHPLEQFVGSKVEKGTKCWVTSYDTCSKSQTIDLLERGCSTLILDEIRPDICVSEWYAARSDCGMKYKITIQLLKSKTDKVPVKQWTFEDTKAAGKDWFKAEETFSDYEPGVRFIRYYHEGKDTRWWAGRYGAKMTLSSVILDLTHTACGSSSNAS